MKEHLGPTSRWPSSERVKKALGGDGFLIHSPEPGAAQRRWDAVGLRTMPNSSLMTYILPEKQIDAECGFAPQRMWLRRL